MSLDKKTARHICNVTRRQIQNSFPDLHIHFCVHGENTRRETLTKEFDIINEHPAGKYLTDYHDQDAVEKIMRKNKSRFVSIARHNTPGFLGFCRHNSYFALCLINHERFTNEENLRNHAYSIAWHAIATYREYLETKKNRRRANMASFIDDNNVLIPNVNEEELALCNLMADIFSVCAQTLSGRKNVIKIMNEQRLSDTLTPQKGFRSEQFPFPVCTDQLEVIVKKLTQKYKKEKKTVFAAVKMTEEIREIYDTSIVEQWKSFSLPAQQMAWTGHSPEIIIGAALYTAENTHTQAIADMVAEKMEIKPESISGFQINNPFTKPETNAQTHRMMGKKIMESALNKVRQTSNHKELLDIAYKQNELLSKNDAMGWSAGALLRASEMIKHCENTDILPSIIEQSKEVFWSEFSAIHWDTLNHFSYYIFKQRLSGKHLSQDDIIELSAENEEFTTIYNALYALKLAKEEKVPDQILTQVDLEQQDKDFMKYAKTPDQ